MIPADVLLKGYSIGYFPMADEDGSISWYSPDPRAIIPISERNIPRSTKQLLRKEKFSIEIDNRFEDVMRGCAGREETWISEEIIQSYVELHKLGYAHSVEAVDSTGLVGGLYGVALGAAFFGESMFSKRSGGSKVALAFLIRHLLVQGFTLLDTQYTTPHLEMFGAIEIPKAKYVHLLEEAIGRKTKFV